MNRYDRKNSAGFTLLEMLLVLGIISSILVMVSTYLTAKTNETRRDTAVMRYEQILNAGLAHYINYSAWPASVVDLVTKKYLPQRNGAVENDYGILNAWAQPFVFFSDAATGTFSVCSVVTGSKASSEATILAGRLPMAYTAAACTATASSTVPAAAACAANSNCAVVSTVNIPGQNLNNARSVNFAGVYHNGACVPAPTCPGSMTPSIVVAPISVSGTFDGTPDVYPLSSFTAYARGKGGTGSDSGYPAEAPLNHPLKCTSDTVTAPCDFGTTNSTTPSNKYWRVCLDVVTEKGRITGTNWKIDSGAVMAITRCMPTNEPSGSDFTVFQSF